MKAKLSQKPAYEALSYRWTDPDKENPDLVFCNGVDFPVGHNLYAALIRIRLAGIPRALWVDQLCIKQSDGSEQAQQLLIIGDIYSKAERVLAWLGPTDDDSDKAMEHFPKLVDHLQTLDHKQSEKNDPKAFSVISSWEGRDYFGVKEVAELGSYQVYSAMYQSIVSQLVRPHDRL